MSSRRFIGPAIFFFGIFQTFSINKLFRTTSDHQFGDHEQNNSLLQLSDATKQGPIQTAVSAWGGHWEYIDSVHSPYTFSHEVCNKTFFHQDDCTKTASLCPSNLMNWQYITADGRPYPKFNVAGFRSVMRNKSIVFVGDSTARQQVQALTWTLGHADFKWEIVQPVARAKDCVTQRRCMTDTIGNITICHQPMTTMATQNYKEGDFTFEFTQESRDTSCLLSDEFTHQLTGYDLVFVQGIAWWQGLPRRLNSTTSPSEWILELVPTVYKDAMGKLLSNLSAKTKTVLVLGQVGTACLGKTEPEEFVPDNIPSKYGWSLAPKMWNALLKYLDEEEFDLQIVDARNPVMQSVHAHPEPDCLHFCMNSAAVNIYLDMYWNEVFRTMLQLND
ncbi:hypothetical protein ACHAWO_004386 [Cyclotella atomus]|jgi:hypothetical protein|uniref:Trichome birefringence-like C-terminal domain-containing protein n=1 Tax=Cyclotella atomus TaxID=382360 RepID=A0ABD3MWL5_9STRA